MAPLQVRRISYALGAAVTGVDLREPLDDATFAEIRRLWLEHQILYFPNQDLSKQELLAFSSRFGEMVGFEKSVFPDPTTKGVALLTNQGADGKPFNGRKSGVSWHTDKSFSTQPSSATIVNCKITPQAGETFMFTNLYMAYETLSPKMQELLEGLHAVHVSPRYYRTGRTEIPTAQPIVRIHPETGRKLLYIAERARIIEGMSDEESGPIIGFLVKHVTRYEFTYCHSWTVGDLIMWDNRCLLHKALCDYDLANDPRHMIRCEAKGQPSGHEYVEPLPADPGVSGRQHVLIGPAAAE